MPAASICMKVCPRAGDSMGEFLKASAMTRASTPVSASTRPSPLAASASLISTLSGSGPRADSPRRERTTTRWPREKSSAAIPPPTNPLPPATATVSGFSLRAGAREDRLNGASPMPEDLIQLPANHRHVRQLAQRAERHRVIDDVDHAGPIPLGHEGVAMIPAAVRAFQLDVAEPVGRVIVAILLRQPYRDAKERPNSVVDLQARRASPCPTTEGRSEGLAG